MFLRLAGSFAAICMTAFLAPMAQSPSEFPSKFSFPAQWNAPPLCHNLVIAVRITSLPQTAYELLWRALSDEYIKDEIYFGLPKCSTPELVKGFMCKYIQGVPNGTGIVRMEFPCKTAASVKRFSKHYEKLIVKELRKLAPDCEPEIEVIPSEALKATIKVA